MILFIRFITYNNVLDGRKSGNRQKRVVIAPACVSRPFREGRRVLLLGPLILTGCRRGSGPATSAPRQTRRRSKIVKSMTARRLRSSLLGRHLARDPPAAPGFERPRWANSRGTRQIINVIQYEIVV
ncbi:hypothetical protein EVAR_20802_1 [Eumeta japonica]|uniref:Uncharacterized protein n=1 Tax=Eumeta variegata TaxID=151549 RepID=A0A4C1UDM2_EUMVA|nr:hypothetical protein EVAR_20802_1 [Eumeta japonica]